MNGLCNNRSKKKVITIEERNLMKKICEEAMCPSTEAIPLLARYYEMYEFLPFYLTEAVKNKVRLESNRQTTATMRRFFND